MVPLNMRFDGAANVQGSNMVRLPKLSQGAPYSFGIRIRDEAAVYRVWGTISEMVWRIKLRPSDKHELMTLRLSTGNFVIDPLTNTLSFVVKAADWDGIEIPQSENHMELDVPFSFVVEFLNSSGVVVERFAQGSGLISVNLFLA